MTRKIKLSPAQQKLLMALPTYCVREYEPAQRLVALGFAVWSGDTLETTEIGSRLVRDEMGRRG